MRMRVFVYLFLLSFHLYGIVGAGTVSRSDLSYSSGNRNGQTRPGMILDFAIRPDMLILDSEDAGSYRASGMENLQSGQLEEAISDFSKAIELEPDSALTLWARGVAWYYLSEHEKAVADFDRANKVDSTLASAYWFRGLTLREMGLEGWEREMEQGLELWPGNTAEDKSTVLNMRKMFEKLKKTKK